MIRRLCEELLKTRGAASIFLLVLTIAPASCDRAKHSRSEVSFARDIAPIVRNNCAQCHFKGRVSPYMDSGDPFKILVGNGYVVPYKADESTAYMKLKSEHSMLNSLPDDKIELFKAWINEGAPNN
jgi:hypothetical protein